MTRNVDRPARAPSAIADRSRCGRSSPRQASHDSQLLADEPRHLRAVGAPLRLLHHRADDRAGGLHLAGRAPARPRRRVRPRSRAPRSPPARRCPRSAPGPSASTIAWRRPARPRQLGQHLLGRATARAPCARPSRPARRERFGESFDSRGSSRPSSRRRATSSPVTQPASVRGLGRRRRRPTASALLVEAAQLGPGHERSPAASAARP